jgi:hypothetical protein
VIEVCSAPNDSSVLRLIPSVFILLIISLFQLLAAHSLFSNDRRDSVSEPVDKLWERIIPVAVILLLCRFSLVLA